MRFTTLLIIALALLTTNAFCSRQRVQYMDQLPVFFASEPDIPVASVGLPMPAQGKIIPEFDLIRVYSDEFRQDGHRVQPHLNVKMTTIRIGGFYGLDNDTAVGLYVPWERSRVGGQIGGLPASGKEESIGNISLAAKRVLFRGPEGERWTAMAGLELPTGSDSGTFDQSNAATNAYFSTHPRRMPIAWQPGTGSYNGYFAVSYGKYHGRLSYAGLIGAKIHGSGEEDVKRGNMLLGAAGATYGINDRMAGALNVEVRSQSDDDYPKRPSTEADISGTTVNGTTVSLNPSLRFNVAGILDIGVDYQFPIVEPDNGLVPRAQLSAVFYPNL